MPQNSSCLYLELIRTPHRLERTSTVMVPGVKRDPALIFRDQTTNLVMNLVPTSLRFLHQVFRKKMIQSYINLRDRVTLIYNFISHEIYVDVEFSRDMTMLKIDSICYMWISIQFFVLLLIYLFFVSRYQIRCCNFLLSWIGFSSRHIPQSSTIPCIVSKSALLSAILGEYWGWCYY